MLIMHALMSRMQVDMWSSIAGRPLIFAGSWLDCARVATDVLS